MTAAADPARVRRLLVFRTGSLGDTVMTVPVFHLLRRVFAGAERRVLTNFPINRAAAPLQAVLGDSGLVDGYFAYPARTRDPRQVRALWREIAAWGPEIAVYLNEPRSWPALGRDLLFLRLCGARRVIGAPVSRERRRHRRRERWGLWESEAARLARCVAEIGDAAIADPAHWRLEFTDAEKRAAAAALAGWAGAARFVAVSIGAKIEFKSWGDDKWRRVLEGLAADDPGLGLALIGADEDAARSEVLARVWRGPAVNLCGRLAPRISALVIARALIYLGHDSGPMHLAASVGTPAVAVFSTHARPGVWFPFGARHRVFYPGLAWSGGEGPAMRAAAGETNITLIPPDQVLEACREQLRRAAADAGRP